MMNNNGSWLDDWIYWHFFKINYNSSQSMSVRGSLHFLIDYKRLLFLLWLPVRTRMNWSNSFTVSGRTEYKSPYLTVTVAYQWLHSASILCIGNLCLVSRWLAMDFRSGFTISVFRRHVTIHNTRKVKLFLLLYKSHFVESGLYWVGIASDSSWSSVSCR
jgi:predicted small integral membrane protein